MCGVKLGQKFRRKRWCVGKLGAINSGVNNTMNLTYYHIEKCGGIWLRETFANNGWKVTVDDRHYSDGFGHLQIIQNEGIVEPYSDVLILMRNPWSRLLSYYNYSIASALDIGPIGGWTTQPTPLQFLETVTLDRDYGDRNRVNQYPHLYPPSIMPYRSQEYTLRLLGADIEGARVWNVGDPEFLEFLKSIGIEPIGKPLNSSRELCKMYGLDYRELFTEEEMYYIYSSGILEDDINLWSKYYG